jgi:hypothetical protein
MVPPAEKTRGTNKAAILLVGSELTVFAYLEIFLSLRLESPGSIRILAAASHTKEGCEMYISYICVKYPIVVGMVPLSFFPHQVMFLEGMHIMK